MKRALAALAIVVLVGFACSKNDGGSDSPFRSVAPAEAVKLMESRSDLLIVDVRSPQELREGYIEGSVFVPFWEIAQGKADLPKDRPLLLVCAVGGRSYAIGQALARSGWNEIYNLSGGISAWKRSGYPLRY